LLDLNAKRSAGGHLGFFAFRHQNARDSRARPEHSADGCALTSPGNSAKNGPDGAAAADKDRRAIVAAARYTALVIDVLASFRIIGGQASDERNSSAVRKKKIIEVDSYRPRSVHSLRRRNLGDSTLDH